MNIQVLQGDALEVLRTLADASVNCCVTSPPYWGLRDYGIEPTVWGGAHGCAHEWGDSLPASWGQRGNAPGDYSTSALTNPKRQDSVERPRVAGRFCQKCGAWRGSLGLEPTPDLYVAHLIEVFAEVRRVLRQDGTLWCNLGDSYASGNRAYRDHDDLTPARAMATRPTTPAGLKPKDLIGIPWRVAFSLQADGWWLRSDIVWAKPNPMPESVTDRPTRAHEYVFLLSRAERYWYDAEAIRERAIDPSMKIPSGWDTGVGAHDKLAGRYPKADKRRGHSRRHAGFNDRWDRMTHAEQGENGRNARDVWTFATQPFPEAHFATFPEALAERCILAGCPESGTVLDPFGGSGTVGVVAERLYRNAVLIDLSPDYCDMARRRIGREQAQQRLPLHELVGGGPQ